MNHLFTKSEQDEALCSICNRNYLQHTSIGKCEECKAMAKLYWRNNEKENLCLCFACNDKRITALVDSINTKVERNRPIMDDARPLEQQSHLIIKNNGDFFNAKVIAIVDLRKSIDSNDEIKNKDEEFFNQLSARYQHLKDHVFSVDNEIFGLTEKKRESQTEQLAIARTLREYGSQVRAEIREQIRTNDQNYQVKITKVVSAAKSSAKKKTAWDRIVEATALAKGISKEQAEELCKGIKKE